MFLIIALIVISGILISVWISGILFSLKIRSEVNTILANAERAKRHSDDCLLHEKDIHHLPDCVQEWLINSNVINQEIIHIVYLKQKGLFRTKPDQKWMPITAEQYFTIDEPAFIWKASIKMAPLLSVSGRDKYENGKGNMLIKLFSLIKIADASGKEIDQGTLLRFLGEMVWFPSAAVSPYVYWEEINSTTAKATMSYKGVSASGIFQFENPGFVTSFSAKRYMSGGSAATLEDWYVSMQEYKLMNGIKIPMKAEVIWKLKTGDFNYYKFEITEISYS